MTDSIPVLGACPLDPSPFTRFTSVACVTQDTAGGPHRQRGSPGHMCAARQLQRVERGSAAGLNHGRLWAVAYPERSGLTLSEADLAWAIADSHDI